MITFATSFGSYAILAGIALFLALFCIGTYQAEFGARNQVKKLRRELRERDERDRS